MSVKVNSIAAVTVIIFLLVSLSAACSVSKAGSDPEIITLDEKEFPLILNKENEVRLDVLTREGGFFGKTNDQDHLYVYFLQNQDKNCEIVKLGADQELEVKEKFFIQQGIGPGEAQNPRIYGGDKNRIIVWDAPAQKYIKFDGRFQLMDEYRLAKDPGVFQYSGARYVKEHNFVLDGYIQHIDYYDKWIRIYRMNLPDSNSKRVTGNKLYETRFRRYRKKNKRFMSGRPLNFGYFFDFIYILDKRSYRLIKMDINGTILTEKKIHFTSRSLPESLRKEWIKKYHPKKKRMQRQFDFHDHLWPALWLMQVGNGIAVGRCESYDPGIIGPVPADYFDRDLNYLGKITLPYFYWWNHPHVGQTIADAHFYSKDGKLYVNETRDDEHWVVRYSIESKI